MHFEWQLVKQAIILIKVKNEDKCGNTLFIFINKIFWLKCPF